MSPSRIASRHAAEMGPFFLPTNAPAFVTITLIAARACFKKRAAFAEVFAVAAFSSAVLAAPAFFVIVF